MSPGATEARASRDGTSVPDTDAVVYLDHHASTPCDPRVGDAVCAAVRGPGGNPASAGHAHGDAVRRVLEDARDAVARLVAGPRTVVWTSGATESNNLAIAGLRGVRRFVVSAIEHPSVAAPIARRAAAGADVSVLPVGRDGRVDPDGLDALPLGPDTLVAVLAAGNEIGAVQPIDAIARRARAAGAWTLVDAVQATPWIDLVNLTGAVDLVTVSGHKMHAPTGIGALLIGERARDRLDPVLRGGGQEHGLRAGTPNVPGAVGLGCAAALARQELVPVSARVARLRDRLWNGLSDALPDVRRNPSGGDRGPGDPAVLPNNLHVSFSGVDGEAVLRGAPEVAASTGSACGRDGTSPGVLAAFGLDRDAIRGAVRFGLGPTTNEAGIDRAIDAIVRSVRRLRGIAGIA